MENTWINKRLLAMNVGIYKSKSLLSESVIITGELSYQKELYVSGLSCGNDTKIICNTITLVITNCVEGYIHMVYTKYHYTEDLTN